MAFQQLMSFFALLLLGQAYFRHCAFASACYRSPVSPAHGVARGGGEQELRLALRGSFKKNFQQDSQPPKPRGWAAMAAVFAIVAAASSKSSRKQKSGSHKSQFAGETAPAAWTPASPTCSSRAEANVIVCAGGKMPKGRKLRVAVVGGGPGGASCAETLAKAGIETYLIERKLDNAKPCGGAIPPCMLEEFDLPESIIDRKVNKMTMISPTNKEVQIGETLKDGEFIGMVRREVLDSFLRDRAAENGAHLINGLFMTMTLPKSADDSYVLTYNDFTDQDGKSRQGTKKILEVDVVIGADGANSRVAKCIDAGDYEYAMAFQERVRISPEKMKYYEQRAEMYVGDDVSPDFYGWVFPKCDHVAVGTGTVVDKKGIKKYQTGIVNRASPRIEGGEVIRVEAHPIPEHPRPRRVNDRATLIGDAAGYVTKCSGEGIYFAAKSGRMCAQAIVKYSEDGSRMIDAGDLETYITEWDQKYGPTYAVLDLLQKIFYTSDPARESFVELCSSVYVQKVTFDSYLYKIVQGNNVIEDIQLAAQTVGSLIMNNIRQPDPMRVLDDKKSSVEEPMAHPVC